VEQDPTSPVPDDDVPPGSLGRMIERLRSAQIGALYLEASDGRRYQVIGAEPGPTAHVVLRQRRALRRFLLGGAVGAAEAYIDGDWDTPDLSATLEFFAANETALQAGFGGNAAGRAVRRLYHMLRVNTRRGSRRNIAAHYDLGNAFYESWLDQSMTYSCAIFDKSDEELEQAQAEKYNRLCERLAVGADHHVLEIGCGWGGFAEHAAKTTGCKVTGITISREQYDHACRRIHEAGLAERVAIRFQDYRDVDGHYDRVASIEMFEAVGERYWPVFFGKVRDNLASGGRAALQIITIDDLIFERYRKSADFIQRYIFPGGVLPSRTALVREATEAGLAWIGDQDFGRHYADTLAQWRDRFAAARSRIESLGYPDRFRRLWDFYLAYCEAGFRTGRIDLLQISLARRA